MAIKSIKTVFLFLMASLLMGCPGDEDCDDFSSIANVPDLITISPLQTNYNQGDEIILKLEVPAINSYFGQEINLFQATNDSSAFLIMATEQLFLNNRLAFIKGGQGRVVNWFEMPLNAETQHYELELKIRLDRVGSYTVYTGEYVEFQGDDRCNRYRIDTTIFGQQNNMIAFEVE